MSIRGGLLSLRSFFHLRRGAGYLSRRRSSRQRVYLEPPQALAPDILPQGNPRAETPFPVRILPARPFQWCGAVRRRHADSADSGRMGGACSFTELLRWRQGMGRFVRPRVGA